MKRYISILLLVIFSVTAHAGQVYNINSGWRFICQSLATSNSTIVDIPHTWNAGIDNNNFRGVGNYIREVNVPASWNGRRVFVRFYAANSALSILVNGRTVGEHLGGYTACTFEITPFLHFGQKNVLWAVVNNSPRTDLLPAASDSKSYGGLVRDAQLIVTSQLAIAPTDYSSSGVYIFSHKSDEESFAVKTIVKLTSTDDRIAQVTIRITDADNNTVAEATDRVKVTSKSLAALTIPTIIHSPHLWDGMRDPYMYRAHIKVLNDGVPCDSTVVEFGVRDYGFDPAKGLILNGRPYPLRGVTLTPDYAGTGSAVSRRQMEEDLALVHEMGANMVCISDAPHSSELYDLCDRMGIMVWSGLPFTGETSFTERAYFNTPAFRQNGRQQLTEIIRQNFNHPSIVMWGIFNCLGQRGDDPTEYIKELNALAKKEDPGRYTVCTSNQDGQINFITDLVSWQHRFGWSSGSPADIGVWLPYLHRTWGSLSSAVSYGAGGSVWDQSDSLRRPAMNSTFHCERWQTYVHEESLRYTKDDTGLWGIFIDNMFDYRTASNSHGSGLGLSDMGMVTIDRNERKDAFWFYKANWNTWQPFVHIAESRWDSRRSIVQTLKVFSNCPEVEVLLNGTSLGTKRGTNGTFLWPDVAMRHGDNTIQARSGALTQTIRITITTNQL